MISATLLVSIRCSQQWPAVRAGTGILPKISNAVCDMVSWVGFWGGQRALAEKTVNKVCTLVNKNMPYWFLSPDKCNNIDICKMLTLGKEGEGSTVLNEEFLGFLSGWQGR